MSLRQAPRFQAWFSHLEGREVMVMSRHDWEQANQLPEGEMGQIDLSSTPIANVARDSRIEAAVVVRTSPTEVVVEVYRYDPVEADLPRAIHHPHSAARDFFEQFVVTEWAGRAGIFRGGVRQG